VYSIMYDTPKAVAEIWNFQAVQAFRAWKAAGRELASAATVAPAGGHGWGGLRRVGTVGSGTM